MENVREERLVSYRIYADRVWIMHTCINVLLLFLTAKLSGITVRVRRIIEIAAGNALCFTAILLLPAPAVAGKTFFCLIAALWWVQRCFQVKSREGMRRVWICYMCCACVLGGVCNGLATYFRVDPTLVRLLFCSPLLILVVISVIPVVNALCGFFGTLIGVSFLLYLILWFAIPKARTPRQRLEMTGERITASSIRRNISADLNDARPSPRNERTASVFSELLYVTGRVLLFCIKAFLLLIGAVLGLVVLGLVVGLVTMLIGGAAVGFPFALAGGSLLIPVLIVLGIVLPLGIVVYLLLKLVFNLRSRRTTLSVLFGIWVLILIFLGVYLVKNYERIEEAFDRGDVEWYFNKTSGWHGAGVPDGIPIRHDTVRVETVTLGDSTLRDTVRIEYYTE